MVPTSNHIVCTAIEEEMTKSGIVIPDTASKEKPIRAKVIAVGPGELVDGQRVPMEVKEGDTVIFKDWGPSKIKLDGQEFLLLKDTEVFAILK